jgi:hypothetical protein
MGKFLAPKITTTDRTALTLDDGEIVYDTDLQEFYYGDGVTAGGVLIGGSLISNTAYGAGWNGDTTNAPSKNAVYDEMETKQDTLVSGTSIKTINSNSLLGSGDIAITVSPAGSDTQIQFNDGGSFQGDLGLTYNKTTDKLSVGGSIDTPQLDTNTIQAKTSGGLVIEATGGADCALFGAGGGQNVTFYDGVKLDAETASAVMITDSSKNIDTLVLGANQSIRRNAGNTAYEAYTPITSSGLTQEQVEGLI